MRLGGLYGWSGGGQQKSCDERCRSESPLKGCEGGKLERQLGPGGASHATQGFRRGPPLSRKSKKPLCHRVWGTFLLAPGKLGGREKLVKHCVTIRTKGKVSGGEGGLSRKGDWGFRGRQDGGGNVAYSRRGIGAGKTGKGASRYHEKKFA